MKTLHLVLKSKWYDKIAAGEKTSEYRECKPYWNRRFTGEDDIIGAQLDKSIIKKYDHVVFHKGYTSETMEFNVRFIDLFYGVNDLNLHCCWQIKLGDRIK